MSNGNYPKSQDYGTTFSRDIGGGVGGLGVPRSTVVASRADPAIAFEYDNMEYWGSPHSSLDDIYMSKDDLLVNGYGTVYNSKPFIKSTPNWLSFGDHNINSEPHQLLLNWKDFSPPPASANIDFWETIVSQAKEEGIKRIICCCGAGLGRTGTALASLALASGKEKNPQTAIEMIRQSYNRRAIETRAQELYIWRLVLTDQQITARGFFDEKPRHETNRHDTPIVRRGVSFEDDDDGTNWSNWTSQNLTNKK